MNGPVESAAGEPSSGADRAELERLRLEVAQLRTRRARRPARSIPAFILILLACLLAPLSIVSVWASDFVGDTDRYVATVAPLAENPDVQNAVTNRVSNLVMQQLDVPAQVDSLVSALESKGLGERGVAALTALSGPITSGVTSLVHSTVAKVASSQTFAQLWEQVNRRAHAAVVNALTGQSGGVVVVNGNAVTLDLAPVVEEVKTRLVDSGLSLAAKIPPVHTNLTIYQSESIPKLKTGFRLLQIAGAWLPIITVLIGALGVALALRHRNALIGISLGIAVATIILGAALAVGRTLVLQKLPPGSSEPAASAVIDAVLHFLRITIRTVVVLALVVALGAFLSGPARFATAVRRYCVNAIGALKRLTDRAGWTLGPVGPWVHRARAWLTWAVLLITALVFALWNHPTVAVVVWSTVIVLVALAIIEYLDRAARPGSRPL